jgi:site-specific DNA-methyltransferase (adenine-specific)
MISEVYNEDCMIGMARYPDKYFDLAIVDPPYGIGQYWMKSKKTYNYGRHNWNDQAPGEDYFQQLFRVSKNQIIWGANYYCHYLPERNSWIIWDKNRNSDKTHMSEAELAWTSLNIVMKIVKITWDGIHKAGEHRNIPANKNIHPCQRPVQLYTWLLQKFATPAHKILDTHLGSGSSRIACYDFGCDFVGFEIDPVFYEKQNKRFEIHKKNLVMSF